LASYLKSTSIPLQRHDPITDEEVHEGLRRVRLCNHEISFISPRELEATIKRLPNGKAPGEDLITNIIIKRLPKKCLVFLTSIYNACMRKGYFPTSWKNALVIFFLKPGKPKK